MHVHQFWWVWSLRFWRYCYFQKQPNFSFRPWTIFHGVKKFNRSESTGKFMYIRIDVKYIHTNSVGMISLVLEILLLSKTAKFLFPTMDYIPWCQKI